MDIYAAPMEGITGHVYRRALQEVFGGYDKYFIPFISPNQKGHFGAKEKEALAPDNNAGLRAVPQILTRDPDDFIRTAERIMAYGYREINLNLGCPSRTVASKGRGAGFLQYPDELERFLDAIYGWAARKGDGGIAISLKTRIGMEREEEFPRLLAIYNRFPYEELIVHPRLQADYYKYPVRPAVFGQAYESAADKSLTGRLCYNGDLFAPEDVDRLRKMFPLVERVMLGRGMLEDPGLARRIKTGRPLCKEELIRFHGLLYEGLQTVMPGPRPVLCKMKEIWFYMQHLYDTDEIRKCLKKIKKAQYLASYEEAVHELFDHRILR